MTGRSLKRRSFLLGSAAVLGVGGGFGAWSLRERRHGTLLSAFENARGDQFAGGVSLDTGAIFGARIPMRAHGCAIDPTDPLRVIFFARRPGTQAFELRRDTLQVRTIFETTAGQHLAGHGLFSRDGRLLYTPEHDYARGRGIISVRDSRSFAVVGEIDTRGIDPHEIAWGADGASLLVANGGIMTHPRTFRRKLNIPTMDPSLCRIDAARGECLEQWRLDDHLLSIRHLAPDADGSTAIGLQYEGEPHDAPGIVALYRPGHGLRLLTAPPAERLKFRGYVASVAISQTNDLIAAACPYGSGVACWSLAGANYLGFISAHETYGLSPLADGAMVASQRDGTAYVLDENRLRSQFLNLDDAASIRWDDHWVSVA
jgi:hypothetical protein